MISKLIGEIESFDVKEKINEIIDWINKNTKFMRWKMKQKKQNDKEINEVEETPKKGKFFNDPIIEIDEW